MIGGRCLSPPARIALAGKALRVRLDAYHLEKKALPVVRLAPFYTSLARPQVVSEAGSPLAFVPPPTPYGVGGLIDLASLIAQSVVRDPEGVDVVFRWQVEEAALVARLEGRTERDEAGIAREDQAPANFYRFQEQRGRIKDSRFAELFHGLREMIVDRVAFFGTLNPFEDAFWDELYEKLFL